MTPALAAGLWCGLVVGLVGVTAALVAFGARHDS